MDECVIRKIELFVQDDCTGLASRKSVATTRKCITTMANEVSSTSRKREQQLATSSQTKPLSSSTYHSCNSPTSSLASVGSSPSSSSSLSSPVTQSRVAPTRSKPMSGVATPRRNQPFTAPVHATDMNLSRPSVRSAKQSTQTHIHPQPQSQSKKALSNVNSKPRKDATFFSEHEVIAIFSTNEVLKIKKTETGSEDEIEVDI